MKMSRSSAWARCEAGGRKGTIGVPRVLRIKPRRGGQSLSLGPRTAGSAAWGWGEQIKGRSHDSKRSFLVLQGNKLHFGKHQRLRMMALAVHHISAAQNPKNHRQFKVTASHQSRVFDSPKQSPRKGAGNSSIPQCSEHRWEPRSSARCPASAALTSVVLHAGVVGDALRPKAQAQDVPRVRTVSHQEGPVRLPLQLHLSVLPVHGAPVPPALGTQTGRTSARRIFISNRTQYSFLVLLIPFKCQNGSVWLYAPRRVDGWGLLLLDQSAAAHSSPPRSGKGTEETTTPLSKHFSRLKDLPGRKAGDFFQSYSNLMLLSL